jgi:hypothetical protein
MGSGLTGIDLVYDAREVRVLGAVEVVLVEGEELVAARLRVVHDSLLMILATRVVGACESPVRHGLNVVQGGRDGDVEGLEGGKGPVEPGIRHGKACTVCLVVVDVARSGGDAGGMESWMGQKLGDEWEGKAMTMFYRPERWASGWRVMDGEV